MRPFLVAALVFSATALPARQAPGRGEGRLRPPAPLECERNQLTSYAGAVSGYKPGASARYLLRGEPFTAAHWPQLESRPGRLVQGMRAVAWVCLDGKTAPLIDWQPLQR